MRVLLTGSSGWLGLHLAPLLRREGHEVTGFDAAPGIETHIVGSVADAATVCRLFDTHGFDAVIHAAALHKPDIARFPNAAFVDVNVSGTLNLLEASIAAGVDRFVFTSTTSLMISDRVRAGRAGFARQAWWLDEDFGPLEPRNIYGVTKRAAEQLCHLFHQQHGLPMVVLRTGRFFPEEDDTHRDLAGENRKANEFLNRRLTVEDCAEAHRLALERAPALGYGLFIVSAPPPFRRDEAEELLRDAPSVIARHFPRAAELYARLGWRLPDHVERVYDPSLAEARLGFRARTDFGAVLAAIEKGGRLPFVHDPNYVSPLLQDGEVMA
ncbi:MAG: NAD-dependent epimerase/dehydratase family protein [Sphingosinicella sp.]